MVGDAGVSRDVDNLLEAYRGGGGVSWAALGDDAREAQAALNRPWFESQLATALNSCVNVREILTAPSTPIADVGCGAGWSTIALAKAYPHAELVGFDIDPPSIEMARAAAIVDGVAGRVSFRLAEGETLSGNDQFDAAFAFECLHDMPRPVEVLSSTPSAGTGTVFRRPILTDYATRAGFSRVEVLPIEDFSFFRFYRLHH
jgi:SAM-dependent methyltransferase